jgi:hypothetical protein
VRLIGLHGRKTAGKDETFKVIHKLSGGYAERRAFGDKLKESAMEALGFYPEDADAFKETGLITASFDSPYGEEKVELVITGRAYLQMYGTEAHRDVFGEWFWIDQVLPLDPEADDREYPLLTQPWQEKFRRADRELPDYAVVTDVRFPEEADRILYLGGEIWRIDSDERLGENEDMHPSEAMLPESYISEVIDNNGTLEELTEQVKGILDE